VEERSLVRLAAAEDELQVAVGCCAGVVIRSFWIWENIAGSRLLLEYLVRRLESC
jgi:hypothetical protein